MFLERLFRMYGWLCASHPWEVLIFIVTLTLTFVSLNVSSSPTKSSTFAYANLRQDGEVDEIAAVFTFIAIRFLAILHLYLQFKSIRQHECECVLVVAVVFAVFSGLAFSVAVSMVAGSGFGQIHEALPFFLLLLDLRKVITLVHFLLKSSSQKEVVCNMASGLSYIGPAITLNSLVQILVISVGTLSGIRRLEIVCCFGCLSVLASYLSLILIYPACLAIFLEISRKHNQWRHLHRLQYIAGLFQAEEVYKHNPVAQRVKIIMLASLTVVHTRCRLLAQDVDLAGKDGHVASVVINYDHFSKKFSPVCFAEWWNFLDGILTMNAVSTIVVLLVLTYLLLDSTCQDTPHTPQGVQVLCASGCSGATSHDSHCEDRIGCYAIAAQKVESGVCNPGSGGDVSYCMAHEKSSSGWMAHGMSSSDWIAHGKSSSDWMAHGKSSSDWMAHGKSSSDWMAHGKSSSSSIDVSQEELKSLSDCDVLEMVNSRRLPLYKIERAVGDYERGVRLRRMFVQGTLPHSPVLDDLPYRNYYYNYVDGACCENVIGYVPIPVGVTGPLLLNGENYFVPMATTEGCLVASVNRGCNALQKGGGVCSVVYKDGMTRAPVVEFPNIQQAVSLMEWVDVVENFQRLKEAFDSTSRFARLKGVKASLCDRQVYLRFSATTGDAMGMNMLSKGCEKILCVLQTEFRDMTIVGLSGNMCTDKKPSAVNWLDGRGKSVVCSATVPGSVLASVLKTTPSALVELNYKKNLQGSIMAGAHGGFNAHAANMVTAIFLATGQDAAQSVSSSNCITTMWPSGDGDLYISCTMPSVELGTVGGGTILPPQAACLELLGVKGADADGANAKRLSSIVCGTVLAGELSLMAALASGHLVHSHLQHNRSTLNFGGDSETLLSRVDSSSH